MYAWIQMVNLLQTGPEFGGMPIGQGGGVYYRWPLGVVVGGNMHIWGGMQFPTQRG